MGIGKKIEETAKDLKLKAEARSVDIEGTVRENLGEYSDDSEAVQEGQGMQEKADALRTEADDK